MSLTIKGSVEVKDNSKIDKRPWDLKSDIDGSQSLEQFLAFIKRKLSVIPKEFKIFKSLLI